MIAITEYRELWNRLYNCVALGSVYERRVAWLFSRRYREGCLKINSERHRSWSYHHQPRTPCKVTLQPNKMASTNHVIIRTPVTLGHNKNFKIRYVSITQFREIHQCDEIGWTRQSRRFLNWNARRPHIFKPCAWDSLAGPKLASLYILI
jgi:hypothetical protein